MPLGFVLLPVHIAAHPLFSLLCMEAHQLTPCRCRRRSKLFKVVVGSALAFLALSKATFIDDESISQAAEPVKKHIALL